MRSTHDEPGTHRIAAMNPAALPVPATPQADRPARRMPGEAGIWLFVFGDMLMFSLFFVIFLVDRAPNVALFAASQAQLSQTLGVVNTSLMLSSSWCVAMAVQLARHRPSTGAGPDRATAVLLLMALCCGIGFAGVKAIEYTDKIRAGITLTSNDFYMYYFMFTGIHLVHVLLGMGVLAALARATWARTQGEHTLRNLESGASFWHLVDLLWIVLFALLYLVK